MTHPNQTWIGPMRLRPLLTLAGFPLAALLAACLACTQAAAQEPDGRSTLQVRVGETHQIAVFGGHKSDCVTSTPPNSIDVVQPPKFGTLSQREGAPYTSHHSLAGTCLGSRFVGTGVDYTARKPGSDTVALDGIYNNGQQHKVVTIIVVP